jgi:hypothetical protein
VRVLLEVVMMVRGHLAARTADGDMRRRGGSIGGRFPVWVEEGERLSAL